MASSTVTLFSGRSSVDSKDIKTLEGALRELRAKAIPHAVRNTLNDAAFDGRKGAVSNIRKDFINRNKFTASQLWVTKAQGTDLRSMQSKFGHTQEYMAKQEEGFTKRTKGSVGIAKPTTGASGEGQGAKVRLRPVRRSNYMNAIDLSSDRAKQKKNFANPRQAVAVAIAIARRSTGKRLAFIPFSKKPGIYRVGGTRKWKHGGKSRAKLFPLYIMDAKEKRIDATPWMEPAVGETVLKVPSFYERQIRYEIKQAHHFRQLKRQGAA